MTSFLTTSLPPKKKKTSTSENNIIYRYRSKEKNELFQILLFNYQFYIIKTQWYMILFTTVAEKQMHT